jgi:F420H(2)-dependent quinone reductase
MQRDQRIAPQVPAGPNGGRVVHRLAAMVIEGEYAPSAWGWVAKQVDLYESSGGTEGLTLQGAPCVVMTMRGRRSGKVRKAAVMRIEHEGTYAAVASKGGDDHHPGWYLNILAYPDVTVQDGPDVRAPRPRGRRGGESHLVGPGRRGLAVIRRVPAEDRPAHPGGGARNSVRLRSRARITGGDRLVPSDLPRDPEPRPDVDPQPSRPDRRVVLGECTDRVVVLSRIDADAGQVAVV